MSETSRSAIISTHDLTRRSTPVCVNMSERCTFQLTTSQGGRLVSPDLDIKPGSFQLTTSRRGRQQHFELDAWQFVFQLTTSRGGRRKPFLFKQEEKPFQLTTSRGGRLLSCQALRCHWYFNSRPRKEVDEHLKRLNPSWIIFQLTTSQGGRH